MGPRTQMGHLFNFSHLLLNSFFWLIFFLPFSLSLSFSLFVSFFHSLSIFCDTRHALAYTKTRLQFCSIFCSIFRFRKVEWNESRIRKERFRMKNQKEERMIQRGRESWFKEEENPDDSKKKRIMMMKRGRESWWWRMYFCWMTSELLYKIFHQCPLFSSLVLFYHFNYVCIFTFVDRGLGEEKKERKGRREMREKRNRIESFIFFLSFQFNLPAHFWNVGKCWLPRVEEEKMKKKRWREEEEEWGGDKEREREEEEEMKRQQKRFDWMERTDHDEEEEKEKRNGNQTFLPLFPLFFFFLFHSFIPSSRLFLSSSFSRLLFLLFPHPYLWAENASFKRTKFLLFF